jgi:hypothetical protein
MKLPSRAHSELGLCDEVCDFSDDSAYNEDSHENDFAAVLRIVIYDPITEELLEWIPPL